MNYRVVVLPNALASLEHYHSHAAKNAPQTADRWLARFEAAIEKLAYLPERWPLAPESITLNVPIRQMLFGKRRSVFRVLFSIHEDEVRVLHVRRSTMDLATMEEIFKG